MHYGQDLRRPAQPGRGAQAGSLSLPGNSASGPARTWLSLAGSGWRPVWITAGPVAAARILLVRPRLELIRTIRIIRLIHRHPALL